MCLYFRLSLYISEKSCIYVTCQKHAIILVNLNQIIQYNLSEKKSLQSKLHLSDIIYRFCKSATHSTLSTQHVSLWDSQWLRNIKTLAIFCSCHHGKYTTCNWRFQVSTHVLPASLKKHFHTFMRIQSLKFSPCSISTL